jgi:hypothetical protein
MIRKLACSMFALSAFLFVSTPERSQGSMNVEGQPSMMQQGALASYWIWHDRDGFHLRVTTAHDRRTFTGLITFSGELGWARAYELGPEDEVRVTNQGIRFRILAEKNINGFDFRVGRGSQATVHLEINDMGPQKLLQSVFLGQNNVHPMSNDFTLGNPTRQGNDTMY